MLSMMKTINTMVCLNHPIALDNILEADNDGIVWYTADPSKVRDFITMEDLSTVEVLRTMDNLGS